MDADERHEDLTGMDRIEYCLTMKCMKMHEGKPGSAGRLTGFKALTTKSTKIHEKEQIQLHHEVHEDA